MTISFSLKTRTKPGIIFCLCSLIISFLFVTHIFTIQSSRDQFIQYDWYYFLFCTLILFLAVLFIPILNKYSIINYCVQDLLIGLILIYLIIQTITKNGNCTLLALIILLSINQFLIKNILIGYQKHRTLLLGFFCLAAVLCALIYIFDIPLFTIPYNQFTYLKINSGTNAGYFCCLIPFLISSVYYFSKGAMKILGFAALALCVDIVINSHARASWIAAIAGCFTFFYLKGYYGLMIKKTFTDDYNKRIPLFIFTTAFVLGATYFLFIYKPGSTSGRLLIYRVCLKILTKNPLTGIGLGHFKSLYNLSQATYFKSNPSSSFRLFAANSFHAFDDYLNVAIEVGILGLTMILIFISSLIRLALKNRQDVLVCGAAASIISILVTAFFSYPITITSIQVIFVFYIALILYKAETFQYKLTGWLRYLLLCPLTVLLFLFLQNQFIQLKNIYYWKKASYIAKTESFAKAELIYHNIYPKLQFNGEFLFNYGSELYEAGDYNASVKVLEKAENYYPNNYLYMYLGAGFEQQKRLKDAEAAYSIAVDMVPSKFASKQLLLEFYLRTHQMDKAKAIAREIILFPVKIPSKEVEGIKSEARAILK